MDYEEFDLFTDVNVLDVDLPTFLDDDYHLPTAGRQFDVAVGVPSLDSFVDFGSYAVNEFGGENCSLAKSFDGGLQQFPISSLLCTQTLTSPSNQRQNSSSPFLASWHENFVDVEDEFALLIASAATDNNNSFLQNVLQQAESDRNVDDFLDIVDQSAHANPSGSVQNPQQILAEIYRECQQIDSSSPRLPITEIGGEFSDGGYYSPPPSADVVTVYIDDVTDYNSVEDVTVRPTVDDVGECLEVSDDDETCESRSSANFSPESSIWSAGTRPDSTCVSDHAFSAGGGRTKNKKSKRKSSSTGINDGRASIKKKCQNRVAASRYRSKKKLEKRYVESEASILENRNVQLRKTVDEFEREIAYLKNLMKEVRAVAKIAKKKKSFKS